MKKILFFGDSITDAGRCRDRSFDNLGSLGMGYVRSIAGALMAKDPTQYTVMNVGISGDRIVDLYARIKKDVWNHSPDIMSILVGVNDIWHEIDVQNGVDVERFDKMYRLLIEDTITRFPNLKIILCEPFVLEGTATIPRKDGFSILVDYQKVVKNIALDYGLYFLPLQEPLNEAANKYGAYYYSDDGVHPNTAGAELIAKCWLELFYREIDKEKNTK